MNIDIFASVTTLKRLPSTMKKYHCAQSQLTRFQSMVLTKIGCGGPPVANPFLAVFVGSPSLLDEKPVVSQKLSRRNLTMAPNQSF